ncbi:scamp family-domain-containing protein [Chytridium lagenaria]|nr:scamp family-domain-containing protein [Chytridium lagenaria]
MPNPFTDPEANPFEESTHTRGTSSNPWGPTNTSTTNLTSVRSLSHSNNNLAAASAGPSHPPPPRPVAAKTELRNTGNTASLSSREAEIERREAELRASGGEGECLWNLTEKESQLGDHHPPNWPPCKPMIYHDIQNDIPETGRWIVKRMYMAFYLSAVTYLANFVAAFALLVVKAESAGGTFGLALVIFWWGRQFVFWYRPLYSGVKNDRSISFFFFFFNYCFHLAVSALLAVGIPGWGGAGIIYTLSQLGSNPGTGILCAIASSFLIFEVVYGLWQVKAVQGYYRSKGLTAEQAKQQAINGVAGSGIGRELAGAAVRSSMAPDVRK